MTELDRTLDEDLSALIDGELAPEREALLRARIAAEPALARRLAELQGVSEALRALPELAPSSRLREQLRARMLAGDADAARSRRRSAAPWIGVAAALAASLVLVVVLAAREGLLTAREGLLATEEGGMAPESEPAEIASELEAATDEEIGIALEYDTLSELELIEELDVLEWMAERG
jgi:anti-sigma factor RsiW